MDLLLINSILLVCANVVLAVAIARKAEVKDIFWRLLKSIGQKCGNKNLSRVRGENTDTAKGMNLPERLEFYYIEKSNIRHYIPFMNIYILNTLIVVIFLAVFMPINRILGFLPSSLFISAMISIVPLFALDLLSRYNSETVRKRMSEYISVLNRWCSVKEDIMFAFERSLDSNVGEPLETFIRDMVIQVNRGMDYSEALDMLQMKVDNPQFRDFIVNVKLSLQHRGDIIKLLTNLENQFYRIDEEYNRRKISTYKDRLIIYFVMFAVLGLAYLFMNFTPQVGDFYLRTLEGKLLLTVFSGMYALGFYLTAGITKFKN
ncbi:MAG: hypothetical protein ABFD25_22460 [Clostridiaceae bacterium]